MKKKYRVVIKETALYGLHVWAKDRKTALANAEEAFMENLKCPYPCDVLDRDCYLEEDA